jgi:hypothetical protein
MVAWLIKSFEALIPLFYWYEHIPPRRKPGLGDE